MKDYIILDIGKIVLIREDNVKKYYKEVDGDLFELSENELLQVIDLFNKNNGYDYDSERLTLLVNSNTNIDFNNRNYLLLLLEFLERIIPENCCDNFYRNVETLSVELNFNYDFSTLSVDNNEHLYSQSGGYNTRENKLKVLPEYLKKVWKVAQTTNNPTDFYQKEVSITILHELSHMASSSYDHDTLVSLCGFDKYPSELDDERNRGLTEGMTEAIAMTGVPGTVEIVSGYYIEALFVNQLIQIVGLDVMLTSYFSNKGTKDIENRLNELITDNSLAHSLFRRMEDNYQISHIDTKQTFLGNIQTTLITYFNEKMLRTLEERQMSDSKIETEFSKFEQMLVTPQKLEIMEKDPNNYVGLSESLELFYNMKNEFKKVNINSNKQML